jgi:hypothetical protein
MLIVPLLILLALCLLLGGQLGDDALDRHLQLRRQLLAAFGDRGVSLSISSRR